MKSKLFNPFEWGTKHAPLWTTLGLLLLSAWQLPAQTTTITTNSFLSLQNAVAAGGTCLLSFNGVVSATNSLLVTKDLTLYTTSTNTVTINGNSSNRLFQVSSNATLTISNLTLSGGNNIGTNGANGANGTSSNGGANGNSGGSGGNGITGFGGAIYNQGRTLAYYCIFFTNSATGGNGGNGGNGSFTGGSGGSGGGGGTGLGGAIYNSGTLLVSNCTFSGNGTIGGSGGLGGTNGTGSGAYLGTGGIGAVAAGAGLYNVGIATIVGCTFDFNFSESGNSQAAGPPLSNQNGSPGPSGPDAQGGGIYNLGTNTVINCTFYQNLVVGGNGGNGGKAAGFNGFNGGNGGNGGNAYGGNLFNDTAGHVSITNCTFAGGESFGGTNGVGGTGNSHAGNPGSLGAGYGANVANNAGTFKLKNSILAYPTNAVNAYGTITDQGYNLSSDATPTLTPTNSHNNLDPLLQPLTTNGGPTLTMALTLGSPAIDAIYDASAPTIDQRGFSRTSGSGPRSDIGAYEYSTNATLAYYNVSGHISLGSNGYPNVTVQASGTNAFNTNNLYSTQTDSSGNYTLANLPGGTYVITPLPSGSFTPVNPSVSLPIGTNVNFVGLPNSTIVLTRNATNSLVNLTVTGMPNTTYRIQASTSISTGWQDIGVRTTTANGTFAYPTPMTGFTYRFYRAVTP